MRATYSRVKIIRIRAFLSVGIARLCTAWVVVHAFAWANRKADERRRKEETTVFERSGNYSVSHALLKYFFSSLFPDFSALFFPLYSEMRACISRVANTIEPTGGSSGIFRSHGLPSAKNRVGSIGPGQARVTRGFLMSS